MIKLFLTKRVSNIENVLHYFLTLNSIKHSSLHLQEAIDNHVEDPSMLTVKDVLFEYGVESIAIRKGNYSYEDFETPFICSIQQDGWSQSSFTVVTANDGGQISYLNPISNKIVSIGMFEFESMDKEIVLLLDVDHKKDEINYAENIAKERSENIISKIPLIAFNSVLLLTFGVIFLSSNPFIWISPFFLLTSTFGILISLLLAWHEVDAHNPFIKEVCGGQGRKLNCDAVLSSSGAIFLGISWAVWGFAYFATFFLSTLLFSGQVSYQYLWSILSILVLIYLPFSIYYQSKVVKQWCLLCLSVLAVLFANSIASLYFLIINNNLFDWKTVLHTIAIGLFFLLATYYAVPILKQARESKSYAKRWKKLRYNADVFEVLLSKSSKISVSTEGLGIVVGNPEASKEIIKVCNPYCGPCAKAHLELEQILKQNPDVKVRIVFTASGNDDDIRTAPVAHLLAIQEKLGNDKAHQALDDWYLADNKDYEVFAQKYPMNGELKKQKDKIIAMRDWCNEMKIRATPTIFVNGQELPDSYRIAELKNFF